ncbi:MAG: hypothetical protein LBK06_02820 [Planctomycetaceae bacterium]|jgi:hypothetical protein|nr:hypothetical protein [Planctomycetaceae bacterium]
MEAKRKAWIQIPDYTSLEIGEVSRSEIDKVWGSSWAQKCIRDISERVAIARYSPVPRDESKDYCSPRLGFENGNAVIAVSPKVDVKPSILYGAPVPDLTVWSIYLNVKRGRLLFGLFPIDYFYEDTVSQEDALEFIKIFFDNIPCEVSAATGKWRKKININKNYTNRFVNNAPMF